jgi:uncharacterized membrane protein
MNLVTALTFDDSVSAHLVKTRLENEGIKCFIFDEHINNVMPIYGQAVGGIRIKIKEEDVLKAKQLIEEWELRPFLNQSNETLTCTSCGAQELFAGFKSFKTSLGWLTLAISFLFMIYPFYSKTVYRCKNCGEEMDLNN